MRTLCNILNYAFNVLIRSNCGRGESFDYISLKNAFVLSDTKSVQRLYCFRFACCIYKNANVNAALPFTEIFMPSLSKK